jgi:predicted metal-dependent hydrolase
VERIITLGSKNIKYYLSRSSRAKYLRITVSHHPSCYFSKPASEATSANQARVAVTVPGGMDFAEAENFLRQKASWLLRKIKLAQEKKPVVSLPKSSRREYLRCKEKALELAKRKIEELNTVYNFRYQRVSIRNQKTRWGSCSRKGNLSFNYKIVYLPEKYLNYLIVHEICHLKEFNHSKRFWDLVVQTIPDYKDIRKEFRNL